MENLLKCSRLRSTWHSGGGSLSAPPHTCCCPATALRAPGACLWAGSCGRLSQAPCTREEGPRVPSTGPEQGKLSLIVTSQPHQPWGQGPPCLTSTQEEAGGGRRGLWGAVLGGVQTQLGSSEDSPRQCLKGTRTPILQTDKPRHTALPGSGLPTSASCALDL